MSDDKKKHEKGSGTPQANPRGNNPFITAGLSDNPHDPYGLASSTLYNTHSIDACDIPAQSSATNPTTSQPPSQSLPEPQVPQDSPVPSELASSRNVAWRPAPARRGHELRCLWHSTSKRMLTVERFGHQFDKQWDKWPRDHATNTDLDPSLKGPQDPPDWFLALEKEENEKHQDDKAWNSDTTLSHIKAPPCERCSTHLKSNAYKCDRQMPCNRCKAVNKECKDAPENRTRWSRTGIIIQRPEY